MSKSTSTVPQSRAGAQGRDVRDVESTPAALRVDTVLSSVVEYETTDA